MLHSVRWQHLIIFYIFSVQPRLYVLVVNFCVLVRHMHEFLRALYPAEAELPSAVRAAVAAGSSIAAPPT